MTPFLLYLLEASICLALLYGIYWVFIKNDTFHRLKRFYLLLSLTFSLVIPGLPALKWTEQIEKSILSVNNISDNAARDIFERVVLSYTPYQPWNPVSDASAVNLSLIIIILYGAGCCILLTRFVFSLYQIHKLARANEQEHFGKFTIIHLHDQYPTFSFLRYIFLNEKNLNLKNKNDVLLHEATHLKQGHSLDNLFSELIRIFFWFNPIVWNLKKSLVKVHECLADDHLLELNFDTIKNYQTLILEQYVSKINLGLAHSFDYSLIQYRINMMTKTRSKSWSKFKLFLAIPVTIFSLVAFTNNPLDISTVLENQAPKGWEFRPDRYYYSVGTDDKTMHNGLKSALMQSTIEDSAEFCTLMQKVSVNEFKGKRIRMTGYIKSEGTNDTTSMWVRIDDFERMAMTEFDNMWNRPLVGNNEWTKCEIILDVPDTDCLFFFGFILKGKGKAWVDNVSFEVVDPSVSKTTHEYNAPFPPEYIDYLQNTSRSVSEVLPVNLDFEE